MVLTDDLIAYYRLQEASGMRADSHTAARHLTDHNSTGQALGKIDQAAAFTRASNMYLDLADSAFSLTTDFTISAWVYREGTGADSTFGAGVACYRTGETVGDWVLGVNDDGAVIFSHWITGVAANVSQHTTTATGLSTLETWDHILVRRAGTTYTIWTDGVSRAFTNGDPASGWGTLQFSIGRHYISGTYTWNGRIDCVGVWARALTDAEIAVLASGVEYPWSEPGGGGGLAGSVFGGEVVR